MSIKKFKSKTPLDVQSTFWPETLTTIARKWPNSFSNYERLAAMAAFGQMIKAGASINGWWWGLDHSTYEQNNSLKHVFYFQSIPPSPNTPCSMTVVEATQSLLDLREKFINLENS